MPQCGDVQEAKQTSLWCHDLCECGECVRVCVCLPVCEVRRGRSCANMVPCHPSRRKKNLSGRSWKKSWRRITARLPRLRPSWYALLHSFSSACFFISGHFSVTVITLAMVFLHALKNMAVLDHKAKFYRMKCLKYVY